MFRLGLCLDLVVLGSVWGIDGVVCDRGMEELQRIMGKGGKQETGRGDFVKSVLPW